MGLWLVRGAAAMIHGAVAVAVHEAGPRLH